jgi:Tfp pilus assembly protein PilE
MKMLKDKRGITLIALVITIIVLLILAGITINLTIGEDGIITKAKEAGDKYAQSAENEQSDLADFLNQTENIINSTIGSNNSTNEAGNKVADLTKTTTTNGVETTVTIGQKISDGTGSTVPVPTGFYYVGGTVSTGAVISDNAEDENKYKGQTVVGTDLVGNQYVFIPVDGISLKYEQDHTYDSKYSGGYTSLSGWTDETTWSDGETSIAENTASVQTYGGFYIGRYEAGYPETITGGTTTVTAKTPTSSQVPVSKAGVVAWNLISQENAKTVSERLYGGASSTITSVTSKLVDSYAWDTTCRWLINSGAIQDTNGTINSTSYGNYTNSTFTIPKGTLYVKHKYLTAKSNSGVSSNWYYPLGGSGKYTYSVVAEDVGIQVGMKSNATVPSDATGGANNYTADEKIEIATGTVSNTRTNNIYDLAGNMFEWTTEIIKRTKDSDNTERTFAALRGGSFGDDGSNDPVVYRYGFSYANSTVISIGFRVVLYIK